MFAYNSSGQCMGESHPRAKLTNRDVELVFELREEGMTITEIAKQMECARSNIWKILNGFTRAGIPETYRRERKNKNAK